MAFTMLVAADISGEKHNLELQFPHPPTIPEFESTITETYLRQFGAGKFVLGRMQIYDEVLQKWSELSSTSQLKSYAQVYAFNRNSVEVQKPIPAPVRPSKPPMPDNATHDEKARIVFDDLDANNNRVIDPDELKKGFRILNFDFTQATIEDLFRKADANQDGVISFNEWQRFTEVYPTMLDSLYFRCKDYWESFRQQQDIKQQKDNLEGRLEDEKRANRDYLDAQGRTQAQQQRLEGAEAHLAEAGEQERQGKNRLAEGQRDADASMRGRAQRAQELEVAKEAERQRAHTCSECQRDTDRAEQQLAWQQSEEHKAQDKERQARHLAEEAQRELDRTRRVEQEALQDLQATREREQQALHVLQEERSRTERAADLLNEKEMELQHRVAKEREADLRAKEAAAGTDRERARREEEDRALQAAREREQQAHVMFLDAQRAVEEMEKKVDEQQQQRQNAIDRRRAIEERERPLLEQEARLREQRDALEEKEAKLRTDASTFHGIRGSAAPSGSPYRGIAAVHGASPRHVGY